MPRHQKAIKAGSVVHFASAVYNPTAGTVRFGCTEPVSMSLMPKVIDRIARQHPNVVTELELAERPDLYRELNDRKVDFIILRLSLSDNINMDRYQTEVLYHEQMLIVAGSRHSLARKKHIVLEDLINEQWILPPAHSFKTKLITAAFHQAGLGAPKISMNDRNSPYQSLLIASFGSMLAVIPDIMFEAVHKSLTVKRLPITIDGDRRPVGIVSLKNRPLSPVADLFIGHVRAVAEPLRDR